MVGLIPASLIGIVSPLCMYGTIPLAASFSEKRCQGKRWQHHSGSILLTPQLILYSAALGKTMLIIRIVTCLLCDILACIFGTLFF